MERTKQEILKQIDAALELWSTHRAKAEYDNYVIPDLLDQSLSAEVDTILAATLDRLAPATSPYRESMSQIMPNKAGALRALRRDYDAGYLFKVQSLVRAEVFADFLEMAEHLLEQGYKPGFPFCLPRMAPLYTRGPPSARNSVHRTIVQLQRPSPQPALTCDRLEPLLSGHSSDTAPHLCPFFVRRASLHSPRVSLPGPVAPRSSAACRRTAAGSDALPPAGASSTSRASPAGLRFSPAAAASSSATSA